METTVNSNPPNIHGFIQRLKVEDERKARFIKTILIIFSIFCTFLLLLYLNNIFNTPIFSILDLDIVSGFCLFVGLGLCILLLRFRYIEYKTVDYSLPTLAMLKKAARRYPLFDSKFRTALLAIIFIDIGISIQAPTISHFITIQIGLLIGFTIGTMNRLIFYKPIKDEALRLIREIEKDESIT